MTLGKKALIMSASKVLSTTSGSLNVGFGKYAVSALPQTCCSSLSHSLNLFHCISPYHFPPHKGFGTIGTLKTEVFRFCDNGNYRSTTESNTRD